MISGCDGAIVYPVAVGLVSAAHAIPLTPTMHAFLHALASNWISAAARLIPLGQTDSQRVLALLEQVVVSTAKRALDASLDDLGSANLSGRFSLHAARDAVHEIVSLMMMLTACSQSVVPANAGTHTPCHFVLALGQRPFFTPARQGLWVPAFAGTTIRLQTPRESIRYV